MKITDREVLLSGDELATAVDAYLAAHNINIFGPRTVRVATLEGLWGLCGGAKVYVDPSGVIRDNRSACEVLT